jgi:pimeloyl-ACP methyl ester carboxylesterase
MRVRMGRAMATFVLIPGAGGAAWYWHLVNPLLRKAGHEAVAVDLPGDDESAGLGTYTDIVVRAIGDRTDVVIVAQSMGGFTAPLVCERVSVLAVVLLNAMIPKPGETAGDWWENTGATKARDEAGVAHGYGEFSLETYFFHDLPADVLAAGAGHERDESPIAFTDRCAFTSWPAVPIHVLTGADDRFFPLDFQRQLAQSRLGLVPDVIPGGHLVALSQSRVVADQLVRYLPT